MIAMRLARLRQSDDDRDNRQHAAGAHQRPHAQGEDHQLDQQDRDAGQGADRVLLHRGVLEWVSSVISN
jgi:hypothetical protein